MRSSVVLVTEREHRPGLKRDPSQSKDNLNSGWQVPTWGSEGNCRESNPDDLFPDNGRPPATVVAWCEQCPVRAKCLEFALESPWMPYGPWGGHFQGEVQQMWLERHPRERGHEDSVLAYLGVLGAY